MADGTVVLENEHLRVELYPDIPVVHRYAHAGTGLTFDGGDRNGVLGINGCGVPWSDWWIEVRRESLSMVYLLFLPSRGIRFEYAFILREHALAVELRDIEDDDGALEYIDWVDLPLLVCDNPGYRYWRLLTTDPDPETGGKMWLGDAEGCVGEMSGEEEPVPLIYGALFREDAACVFLDSNYPLFPQTHQAIEDGRYALSLNTYRPRIRSRVLPPLRARVVFLGDENGDGRVDLSDYRLWLNRKIPDGDPIYREAIWYKILCHLHGEITATFAQAEEVVRAIHNVTDGLPQIVYIIGWQSGGHDAHYPSMDSLNEELGSREALDALIRVCREELNATISYHANLDDAYEDSKDWDDALMGVAGMSHTRDVESGRVFERLEAMMRTIPVEKTIHFDNLRITNCHPEVDPEGIGAPEELVCGLMPIMDWLRARGITVSTEGYNGMPIDPSILVSGFWHNDPTDSSRQIFHRKIMGGGRGDHYGAGNSMDLGIGSSIHQDFTYRAVDRGAMSEERWQELFYWLEHDSLTVSLEKDWPEMVDRIFRGSLLYLFYLEHEMVAWDVVGAGFRVRYDDDIVAEIGIESPDALRVTWGDMLVAEDDDRFVPLGGAVYAYSLRSSRKRWMLPKGLRGKELEVFTLTRDGRGRAPEYRMEGDRIALTLEAGVPVKIRCDA